MERTSTDLSFAGNTTKKCELYLKFGSIKINAVINIPHTHNMHITINIANHILHISINYFKIIMLKYNVVATNK